jgi:hypothetical protein
MPQLSHILLSLNCALKILLQGQAGAAWELSNEAMLIQTSGSTGKKSTSELPRAHMAP